MNKSKKKIVLSKYFTLGHPTAYSGKSRIKKYFNLKEKEIDELLLDNKVYNIHKETHSSPRNPFFIYKKRQQIQIDLVDVNILSNSNNNIKFILNAIDVFTKKAWYSVLKNKKAENVLIAFKEILSLSGYCETIYCDRGKEFDNTIFSKYCKERNIKLIFSYNENKAPVVERLNRSIQNILWKYRSHKKTDKYVNVLPDIFISYNSRYHRTIKMSPNEAELEKNQKLLFNTHNLRYNKIVIKNKNKKPKFKKDDTVYIKFSNNPFTKSYMKTFSEEQYTIHKVNDRLPIPTYTLKDYHNEIIEGNFMENQLTSIKKENKDTIYSVEKIIKTRTRKGKKEYLIKWLNYSNKFNSWEPAENFIK